MRAPLLLLLCAASASGGEYFVSLKNGTGVCVSNETTWDRFRGRRMVPYYKIQGDDRVVPLDEEKSWLAEWHVDSFESFTFSTSLMTDGYRMVTTDGSEHFKRVLLEAGYPGFLAQAVNATLVLADDKDDTGTSFHVHVDHLVRGRKTTWAAYCKPDVECQRLELLQDDSDEVGLLADGLRWTWINLGCTPDGTLVLFASHESAHLRWRAPEIGSFRPQVLFARTYQVTGLFRVPLGTYAQPLHAENQLSRSFVISDRIEVFCTEILWASDTADCLGGYNISRGATLVKAGRLSFGAPGVTYITFVSAAGNVQFQLLNVSTPVFRIGERLSTTDVCHKVVASRIEIWSPSNGCYVYEDAFSAPPVATIFPAPFNSTIKKQLGDPQMQKVCAALGVGPDDEPLRVSTTWGSTLAKCPRSKLIGHL